MATRDSAFSEMVSTSRPPMMANAWMTPFCSGTSSVQVVGSLASGAAFMMR